VRDTNITLCSGRGKPSTTALDQVREAAEQHEQARARLILACCAARWEHHLDLSEIAAAAGYSRERIRALTGIEARRSIGRVVGEG